MSYLPYKVTALARSDNGDLNIIPGATATVLTSTGGYATLREADLTTPISNPFDCDSNGERQIYLQGGSYTFSVDGGQSWEVRLSGATDIQSVATIADLRNFEGVEDGQQVSLLGGTTPGIDGGIFYRVTNGALSDDGRDVIRYAATDVYWVRHDLAKYQIEDAATHNGLTFDQRDPTQLATILRRNYKYQITIPPAFSPPFYTIPVNIYFKGGRYFTDFDARDYRPARANRYYVNPVTGSDSNDGLAWATAFKTVGHAMGLAGDNEIVLAPAKYYYQDGLNAIEKTVGFNLVCEQGVAFLSQEAYPRQWVEDGTYAGMYVAPSAIAGEDWSAVATDLRFFMVGPSGSSATTAGGIRVQTNSLANIQSGQVGVFVGSPNTVIRLPGDRPPTNGDFVVKYAASALNVNFNGALVTHDVYMENLQIGYGFPSGVRFANEDVDCKVVLVNVRHDGGHSAETLEFDCNGWAILVGCEAYGAFQDGFNYHVSPTSGESFFNILEVECKSRWNGKDTSTTNNGSTVHEALRIVRLNCDHSYNQNRNIHDIESSRSFNVGVRARGGEQADAPSFMVGRDGEPDNTNGWLVGCDLDIIRVAGGATLYISDDTTYRDLQVEAGGTVIDYNP